MGDPIFFYGIMIDMVLSYVDGQLHNQPPGHGLN